MRQRTFQLFTVGLPLCAAAGAGWLASSFDRTAPWSVNQTVNVGTALFLFYLWMYVFLRGRLNNVYSFFDVSADAIVVYTLDAEAIVHANNKACELFGYGVEDFSLHGVTPGCAKDSSFSDHDYRRLVAKAAKGDSQQFEWQAVHRDGTSLWIEVRLQTVLLRGTRHVLAVMRDITDRKHAETMLYRLNRTLKMLVDCDEVLVRAEQAADLLQNVCGIIQEIGGYRLASITLAGEITPDASVSAAQKRCEGGLLSSQWSRNRLVLSAMLQRRPVLIKDVRKELHCDAPPEDACRHCSVLAVPLITGSEFIGVLTVDAAEPNTFDGEEVQLMVRLAGNIAFGVASLRAAAEHARTQKKLQASEKNLVEAQAIAHLGSWEFDVEKDEEHRSAEFFRILGLPPQGEECTRDSVFDYIHPADRETVLAKLTATLEKGDPYDVQYRIVRPDGDMRTVHAQGKALTGAGDRITKFIGTVLDVTERTAAKEALQASERRFRELLEKIHLAAMVLDNDGTLTFCNDFLLGLTGWSREEVIGSNWFDVFPPEHAKEVAWADFRKTLATGEVHCYGVRPIVTRDGRRRDISWYIHLLRGGDDAVTGIAGIGMDVTELKSLEEQLRHAQKMEAVGQLAGGIAHDFNNILTVICGYGNLLGYVIPPDDAGHEYVIQIMAAAERAANLIRSLLTFSRKQEMVARHTDLNLVVSNVQRFLRRIIGETISINTICHEDHIFVSVDTGQFEQILINLSTNARDAMPRGGTLTIETRLEELDELKAKAHGAAPGLYGVLSVADTGCGMDEETQRKVFDPFFTTKEVDKGTGLGMAIVYGIVSQHNGHIKVLSEPGKGTRFTILIPAEPDDKAEEHSLTAAATPQGGSEMILVAEDDPAVRTLMNSTLTRFGYRVLLAEDGQDAVKQYRENRDAVQMVIMDVIMPKKSGKDAYLEIREMNPEVKVLFSSGYSADVIKTLGDLDEGVELIRKPVHSLDLLRKVRDVLNVTGETDSPPGTPP